MARQVIVSTIPVRLSTTTPRGDALRDFVASMREQPGCLEFDLYESEANPGSFVTVAQWVDRAAYESHRNSAEVVALMSSAQSLLSGAPTIDPLSPVDTGE